MTHIFQWKSISATKIARPNNRFSSSIVLLRWRWRSQRAASVRIVVVIVIGSTHSIDDDSFQFSFELKVRRTCRVSAASVNGSNVTRERQFLCSDFFCFFGSFHATVVQSRTGWYIAWKCFSFLFRVVAGASNGNYSVQNIIMNFKCRALSPEVYQIDFISCHFVFVVRLYSSKFYVASGPKSLRTTGIFCETTPLNGITQFAFSFDATNTYRAKNFDPINIESYRIECSFIVIQNFLCDGDSGMVAQSV